MSTYWGYRCISHDPPLESEHWLNHGDGILTDLFCKMRAGTWPTLPGLCIGDPEVPAPVISRSGTEWNGPPYWLMEHPRCQIVLSNEYGDTEEIPCF